MSLSLPMILPPPHGAQWPEAMADKAGMNWMWLEEAARFAAQNEIAWPYDLRRHLESGYFEPPPFNEILGPIQPRGEPNGLVVRSGFKVVSWGDTEQVDFTFSAAKSYLSMLAGIAVMDGLISDVDEPVARTVRDGGFEGPHNGAITWRHLLQNTSEWEGTLFGKSDLIDRNRNLAVEGQGRKGDARPLRPPGEHWEYNDVRVNRLSLGLLRLFRRPLPEVFAERIMHPIGASSDWSWHGYRTSSVDIDGSVIESVSGGTHWGGGMLIHAEDQARLGLLMLRRGEWNGKRLLPEAWIADSLRPCSLKPTYGYLWWLNTDHGRYKSASEGSFFASGAGGNLTWVDPDRELVAVMRWIDPSAVDSFIRLIMQATNMKSLETLTVESPRDHTVLVTLNRPEVANAMNTQMGLDLLETFDGFCAAPNRQRCIVITGAGAKAFCAGGDLKQRNGMTDEQWQDQHLIFERAIRAMTDCPVPIIAAVNGAAYAGGLEISLCADFIYAVESARFALTEVTLGIMPGAGGTQNLPRAVGTRRAKEIMLTGRPFSARDALEWGMINRICTAETLLQEALDTAAVIAGNAPISTRQLKQSVNMGVNMDLRSGMMFEIEAYNRLVPTEDRREGIRAFNEKRKPVYQGR